MVVKGKNLLISLILLGVLAGGLILFPDLGTKSMKNALVSAFFMNLFLCALFVRIKKG
jgi:hypothetical protein